MYDSDEDVSTQALAQGTKKVNGLARTGVRNLGQHFISIFTSHYRHVNGWFSLVFYGRFSRCCMLVVHA